MIDRFEVASILRELALHLAFEKQSRFKVRAYERGADALEQLDEDLGTLIEEDRLTSVPGIGRSLAGVIEEAWRTGSTRGLERFRAKRPRSALERDPIPCRVEHVLDVIGEHRAAIEISGDPDRMEMEPRWIRAARLRGIPFVISVDAHSTTALRYVELGVHLARRGGVPAREVLNTMHAAEFAAAVRPAH